ncbi:MAG: hypothetical protein D6761_06445 [Candidatus Dadabacteria bacterium]|nr:MAG: hypothetical protein D6761_06445 [Candidatus Dadabacteria bacterium]
MPNAETRRRRRRRLRSVWWICCLIVAGCAAPSYQLRVSAPEEELYRRLRAAIEVAAEQEGVSPIELAGQFQEILDGATVPRRRAAEIMYDVLLQSGDALPGGQRFREQLLEQVFSGDPVAFLLAVGYGGMIDLRAPAERALYESLVAAFKPLALRGRSFTATLQEKTDIARLVAEAIERGRLGTAKALLVLRVALNDVFGDTTLYDPQVQMVLQLVVFDLEGGGTNPDALVADIRHSSLAAAVEFAETVAELRVRGWDDRRAVLRLLEHYFDSLGRAIDFVIDNGWGGEGDAGSKLAAVGALLVDRDAGDVLRGFAASRYADSGFQIRDPATYGGMNGLVFMLLFPPGSSVRPDTWPIPSLGAGVPAWFEPAAKRMGRVADVLGGWSGLLQAIQAAGAGLDAQWLAARIWIEGDGMLWAQELIDGGFDAVAAVTMARQVWGPGQALGRFFDATSWRQRPPDEQVARLAALLAPPGQCTQGFRRLADLLGPELEADPARNRKYLRKTWTEIPRELTCGVSGAELFAREFMPAWSGYSAVRAVDLLSNLLGVDRDRAFRFLAEAGYDGLDEGEFMRVYVMEDLERRKGQ